MLVGLGLDGTYTDTLKVLCSVTPSPPKAAAAANSMASTPKRSKPHLAHEVTVPEPKKLCVSQQG